MNHNLCAPTGTGTGLLTVRGSRFKAWCSPADSVAGARRAIEEIVRRFPDATHHCWAWRLYVEGGVVESWSDAGEPRGTAGKPLLDQLRKVGLVDAVLVVSRWFGGTKLGRGGLVRAYSECGAAAVTAAPCTAFVPMVAMVVTCPLRHLGILESELRRVGGTVAERTVTDTAVVRVRVPDPQAKQFVDRLTERTAGEAMAIGR